jgi:hypothetical protein
VHGFDFSDFFPLLQRYFLSAFQKSCFHYSLIPPWILRPTSCRDFHCESDACASQPGENQLICATLAECGGAIEVCHLQRSHNEAFATMITSIVAIFA